MYSATVAKCGKAAAAKVAYLTRSRIGYLVASMLAGAYVGMGIALIFTVGAPLAAAGSPFLKALMGASFGIALTLVIIAGSELFTGNTLIMTLGLSTKQATIGGLGRVWAWSWVGNLLGSMVLAGLIVGSGALQHASDLIVKVSAAKMNAGVVPLILRAILCNWLVCLAVWMSMRTEDDTAKCITIFWCLFAFIACGYEHSVANMTLLSMAMFSPHPETVSWVGFARNLGWVTLGNVIGGAVFVGGAYWLASRREDGGLQNV